MARDPNNIDLQSTDPDLNVDAEFAGQSGAGDLMDYAEVVQQWGADTVNDVLMDQPNPLKNLRRSPGCPPGSVFHPQHRMTTPFTVAAVVVVVILVLVFIPTGGS